MIAALLVAATPAYADDHCERTEATADATSVIAAMPSLFARGGYVQQPEGGIGAVAAGRHFTAGISVRIDGLLEARALQSAGRAACALHVAEQSIATLPRRRELEARVRVLVEAQAQVAQIVADAARETAEHVSPAADLIALQLRAERFERLLADVQTELATLPPDAGPTATLAAVRAADHAVQESAQSLRIWDAVRVELRGGYERYVDIDDRAPWFAVASVEVNLGVFATRGANTRTHRAVDHAAAERARTTAVHLATESERASRAAERIVAVSAHVEVLERAGGVEGRRLKRQLWLDLVELRADHAGATAALMVRRAIQGSGR